MTRPFERPALVVALVNGLVVYVLPLAFAGVVALFAYDYDNGSTRVVGVDPNRAYVWSRRLTFAGAYLTVLTPLAFAAAWRTFVHAKRWFECGRWGVIGIGEGALCGFAAALVVLLPGILTKPTQAPPYVLAYGGLASVVGLAVGAILWVTATLTVQLYRRQPRSTPLPMNSPTGLTMRQAAAESTAARRLRSGATPVPVERVCRPRSET